jgi:hypothetical protein
MSEQPQEWTTKYVHELMNKVGADAIIADLHNAALAAERKLRERADRLYHSVLIVAVEQAKELAAEQENRFEDW